MTDAPAWLTVVIAVRDERPNLEPLLAELEPVLAGLGRPFEILVVDDGSADGSDALLAELARRRPHLSVLRFPEPRGKSAAWTEGFRKASGGLICTLDGDLQNDPRDIPRLLERLGQGLDCVSGWRARRRASFWSKRLPSIAANLLVRALTSVPLRDHGCGLKVFRAEALRNLELDRGMHRYVAALVARRGGKVDEVEVADRDRRHGVSRYGLERLFEVPVDLLRLWLGSPHPVDALVLPAIVLLAFVLRLSGLGREDFWSDEMLSWHYASLPFLEIPGALAERSVHPPLYFLLLRAWIWIGGDSESWLRLPSALAGALTVPVLAALGRRMFDRRTALTAAFLLAISPFHVYFSQEARPYALLGLAGLISLSFHERLLRGGGGRIATGYALAGIALAWIHVYGLVALLVQNLHYGASRLFKRGPWEGPSWAAWAGLQALIAAAFAPWIPAFLAQAGRTESYAWLPGPSWSYAAETLMDYSGRDAGLAAVLGLSILAGVVAAARGGMAAKAGLGRVLAWAALPLLAAFLISAALRPVFSPRYGILSAILAHLAAGAGWAAVVKGRRAILLTALVAALASARPLVSQFASPQKQEWREAMRIVAGDGGKVDPVIVWGESPGSLMAIDRYSPRPLDRLTLKAAMDERRDPGRFWLLLADSPESEETLRARHFPLHRVAIRRELKGVTILRLER